MSALFTALVEGETKESLASMVCDLRAINAELVAALNALVEHADNMESQNSDYHEMGEQGPCRSAPLNDAMAALAKAKP